MKKRNFTLSNEVLKNAIVIVMIITVTSSFILSIVLVIYNN